jgi:LmbE family N-acetylglucosaminyl deacetylase
VWGRTKECHITTPYRTDLAARSGEAIQDLVAATTAGVVIALPGDETRLFGATMAMLAGLGIPVHVLAVTSGQRSIPGVPPHEAGPRRLQELDEAGKVLGVTTVEAIRLMEGQVVAGARLAGEIAAWAKRLGVTLVLTHGDQAVGDAGSVFEATVQARALLADDPPLLLMAVPVIGRDPAFSPTVSSWSERKRLALRCYPGADGRDADRAEGVSGTSQALSVLSILAFAANL